jgi:hypothetical protein
LCDDQVFDKRAQLIVQFLGDKQWIDLHLMWQVIPSFIGEFIFRKPQQHDVVPDLIKHTAHTCHPCLAQLTHHRFKALNRFSVQCAQHVTGE